ncbi:MAG: hypothetical protein R3Y66_07600 [Rikenellaceae bacterium]
MSAPKPRRSKTVAQQCRYYEVENIFDYMVETYINGNASHLKELYKELNRDARRLFIEYLEYLTLPAQKVGTEKNLTFINYGSKAL